MASLRIARLTAIIMFAAIYHSAAAIQRSADEWNELVDTSSGTDCKVPSTKCSTLDHLFGGDKKDICAESFGEAKCVWGKCQCKSGYCAVANASRVTCEKEGATAYLDGWNPTRTVLVREPEGFAAEYFFSYDIDTNGLTVNDTHVTFPKHRLIKSAFYRSMKTMGSDGIQPNYEVGIGHHKFFNHNPKSAKNPMGGSMFSKNTKVGVAERLLGLDRKLELKQSASYGAALTNTPDEDTMLSKFEDTISKSKFEVTLPFGIDADDSDEDTRTFLTSAASGLIAPGIQAIRALGLPNKETQDFATDGAAPTELLKRADIVRKQMQAKLAGLSESLRDPIEPKLQTTNCFHWDATDTDTISFDDAVISFALNTKMNSFRGETISAPWSEFAATQGTTVWTRRGNKIEIYYAVAIRGALGDPWDHEETGPGLVMYSAPDGSGAPVTIRPKQGLIKQNLMGYGIYQFVSKQIDDYNGLWDKARCTTERKQYLKNQSNLDDLLPSISNTMMRFYGQGTERNTNEVLVFGKYLSSIATCWLEFLQPAPAYKGKAQYGLFMANALGHVVLEYPLMDQWEDLGSTDWNVCTKNDLMVNGNPQV